MCVWSLAGIETVAMAAVVELRSSPSVPRSGGDAGEVVEVHPVFFFFLLSPAGRGGEGRSWWRLELRFLVVVLQVGFVFDGSAPTGRGGEGSDLLELGADGGGPGRCGGGWLMGGIGELVLWSSSFNETRFRCRAADDSCGLLQWWWCLLPSGWRYDDSGIDSPPPPIIQPSPHLPGQI